MASQKFRPNLKLCVINATKYRVIVMKIKEIQFFMPNNCQKKLSKNAKFCDCFMGIEKSVHGNFL